MKLFEHRDFEQIVIQAADHFKGRGLRPALIEKDYYVTEALRVIASAVGDRAIFKGGTSLSKGWNLIQRFSEDIDIFLDPQAFAPPIRTRGIDRELKRLRDLVDARIPHSVSARPTVTRSAASDVQTASLSGSDSRRLAKWQATCWSRLEQQAGASRP